MATTVIAGAPKLPSTTLHGNLKGKTPNQTSLAAYKVLIDVMAKLTKDNDLGEVDISDLALAIRKYNENLYSGKFKRWLDGAETAGIISLTSKKSKWWASLSRAVHPPSAMFAALNQVRFQSEVYLISNAILRSIFRFP